KLKAMGITHVRIAVSPYPFLQEMVFREENLRAPAAVQFLGEIHRMVKLFTDNNLAVVLAVMPRGDIWAKLHYENGYEDQWASFFWHWGREFSGYNPDLIF